MREVEVKAKVRDREALVQALLQEGCTLGESVTERDTLYAREVGSVDAYIRNADFLRIRERGDGKIIFTLKHHPERHEGRADSMPEEHETEILSRDEMEHALLLMGYHEAVRVTKERRKGKLHEWEVCVDEVEGLGTFIELEEMSSYSDSAPIVARMKQVLRALGIEEEDIGAARYDMALLEKRYT